MCGLNDEKIQERLLSEDMLLEEVYKMAQAIELMTADVAHTKNKDREDLHKMCQQNRFQLRYKSEKVCVLRGTRDVYSVQHGEKFVLNVKRKKTFFETVQKWTTGKSVTLHLRARHIRYTLIYDKFLYT